MIIPVRSGRLACHPFEYPGKITEALKTRFSSYFRKSIISGHYQELRSFYAFLMKECKRPEAGVLTEQPGKIIYA